MSQPRSQGLSLKKVLATLVLALWMATLAAPVEARNPKMTPPNKMQKAVLGWGPVEKPSKRFYEFRLLGTLLEMRSAKRDEIKAYENKRFGSDPKTQRKLKRRAYQQGKPSFQILKVLPVHIAHNPQRKITQEQFESGFEILMPVSKARLAGLELGRPIELARQYHAETQQSIGVAKLVNWVLEEKALGLPAGMNAFLEKDQLFDMQYKNVLKSLKLYPGTFQNPEAAQKTLTRLSRSRDAEIKALATEALASYFGN